MPHANKPGEEVKASSVLNELAPDKLAPDELVFEEFKMSMFFAIEDEFKFIFTDEAIESCLTVQDILDLIVYEHREVLSMVSLIISSFMGIPLARIKPVSDLADDLDIDSLNAVELLMRLSEEHGRDIPDDIAEEFKTVQDVVDYILGGRHEER